MKVLPLLSLFTIVLFGCKGTSAGGDAPAPLQDDLTGRWVLQSLVNAGPGIESWLDFGSEGKMTGIMRSSVMVDLDNTITGTYRRSGPRVAVTGKIEGTMDDGYRKSKISQPIKMDILIHATHLEVISPAGSRDQRIYVRNGAPLVEEPKTQRPVATVDSKTLELVTKIRRKYSRTSDYRDTAKTTSNGEGFQAKQASFQPLFRRNGPFLFKADHPASMVAPEGLIVWSDGANSWLGMGPSKAKRPIGNGLSIVEVEIGIGASLVPSLLGLLPPTYKNAYLNEENLSPIKMESYKGRPCHVFSSESYEKPITFWVDAQSLLILKVRSEKREETVEYTPSAEHFADAEFARARGS